MSHGAEPCYVNIKSLSLWNWNTQHGHQLRINQYRYLPSRTEQDPVSNPFRETMMHIYVTETNQKPLSGLIDIPYKMKIALVLSHFQSERKTSINYKGGNPC